MLSQQKSNTNLGRHQRQNSTPTFNNTKTALHPITQPGNEHHRQSLSVDKSPYSPGDHGYPHPEECTSSVEHTLRQRLTQSLMRETQQQDQTAGPGNHRTQYHPQHLDEQQYPMTTPCQEPGQEHLMDNHLTKPSTLLSDSAHRPLQCIQAIESPQFFQNRDSITSISGNDSSGNQNVENLGDNLPHNSNSAGSLFSSLAPNALASRPMSREGPERPCTPQSQIRTNCFPMTPDTTSFSQASRANVIFQSRTTDSSPIRLDPNSTIKASLAMQRGSSCQDNFAAMRQQAISPDLPSPPKTAPLRPRGSVDLAAFPLPDFLNMSSLSMGMPPWENQYNAANYSPMSNAASTDVSSFQSSPEITHMSLFEKLGTSSNDYAMAPSISNISTSQSAMDLTSQSSSEKKNKQPRSQSMSELDPVEIVPDTGVTNDEITAFIRAEPDNKWSCMWPDCNKGFGRKENVKSHVQTHLDDRQYRCKECDKRFVRHHDLKRHANIHSGVKEYKCPCDRGFVRHDALTRHRQRGMCVGAFPGTPKRISKRGRPKKTRPDTQERLEKSARTRQAALEKRYPGKYASSVSGSSISSYPSPEPDFENMDFTASGPTHLDMSPQHSPENLAINSFSFTPPSSPSHSTGNCFSPQYTQHSRTPKAVSLSPSPNIGAIPEEPEKLPFSNSGSRKSSESYFSTPPELELSSSSPAASKFFDFEGSSETTSSGNLPITLSDPSNDYFGKDFDLSATLTKVEPPKDLSFFNDFLDSDMNNISGNVLSQNAYGEGTLSDNSWADFMN